uniref:Disintegrin and metalloproteinase domain-containing protein 9-like n=1 Tax=Pundamilia nyererei TaxID=303518 RepID=A0A3B4EVX6_9CICH
SQVHCYYHGEVEGYKNSLVAISTCSGLGVIFFENKAFGLEPVPQSTTNDHLLYLLEDVQTEPITCGVVTEATSVPSHEPFEPGQSLTSLLRRKRNLPQTSYVELVLVVDNLRKNNATAVREEMVQMANLLDGYYKQLNIRVVLVGLEIFKDSNPFSVDGSAGNVLGNFVQWRKTFLVPKIRHDIGQLIGQSGAYPGGVLGMAFVGTVCSASSSGGINVFSNNNLAFVSTVVAHEMGHNLGMNHDSANCACNGKSCIECTNKCCNAATCTFTQGSACAHGACCENCQVAGTPCRNSVNTCDLPEYCNGRNESCPNDFYLMDGLPCENNAAYCYEGRCQTYDYQCGHLFAPNTMCGKVQCTNVNVNNPPPGATVSIKIVAGKTCVNADFNLGTDVLDPAYVNPGSPCATGKVCNNLGHCHCENGWGPPYCDRSGWGGSIDSGPAQIYSLRNGLLIFFLLVVPLLVLLILVLLYIFRRESLEPCLKHDPPEQPPPVQGPGVPRPIQP